MIPKRGIIFGILLVGILAGILILYTPLVLAADNTTLSYCCEKTLQGAWCQDSALSNCDTSNNFKTSPSSCEATSYCKLGTCIDGSQGDCQENVPQRVCNDNGGVWSKNSSDEIPQCQLGCCFVGDKPAFTTLAKCKMYSSMYGLTTNYRSDIKDQFQCLASANPSAEGACVFNDENSQKTCLRTTKADCQQKIANMPNANVEFHEGFLCSAPSLGTTCGKSQKTTCISGKDGVYFLDTCNNVANIYDASKIDDPSYWTYIKDTSESCSPDSSNANSRTCGNCDFNLGSTCRDSTAAKSVAAQYGSNICADLSCKYNGQTYQHGETWCATGLGAGTTAINADNKRANIPNAATTNVPGTEYYRLSCYDGEVNAELCSDFRQEICMQSGVTSNGKTFKTAVCSPNLWQDCTSQPSKAKCEDIEKRDCKWISTNWHPTPDLGDSAPLIKQDPDTNQYGACVPLYPPGYDFSGMLNETSGQKESAVDCSQGNVVCRITYSKALFSSNKVVENVACSHDSIEHPESIQWVSDITNMCLSLGDCGASLNYIGQQGSSTMDITYGERG